MKLPPLLRLAMDVFTWRQLLFNRFTLVAVVLLAASGSVVAYVDANDGGTIEGQVVDASGEPVANATVTLRNIPLQGVVKTQSTTTNANGEFRFTNQTALLEYQLRAERNGRAIAGTHSFLYFRGQNTSVVLEAEGM